MDQIDALARETLGKALGRTPRHADVKSAEYTVLRAAIEVAARRAHPSRE